VDAGFTAKPGELALGVVAVALGGGGESFGLGHRAAEDGAGLAIAEGVEGAGGVAVTGKKTAGFVEEAAGEHLSGASVEAFVESGTGRIEADAEDAVAGEGIAAGLPGIGERLAGGEADFEGADELGLVVGVDARGGGGIEAAEESVQPGGAMAASACAEAVAEAFGALRTGEEAVEEGAQIEAGAAGNDGEVAAGGDVGEGLAGEAAVVAGSAEMVRREDVEEVVGDLAPLLRRGFGGADLHIAIDGDGVAADNLSVEAAGEGEREGRFAAAGWAEQSDEKRLHKTEPD
jgi:hypothetical protein